MFHHIILPRKIADKVAASGFLVVVPDFFYGDPAINPDFDRQIWLKAHPVVRFLLHSVPISLHICTFSFVIHSPNLLINPASIFLSLCTMLINLRYREACRQSVISTT